VRKVHRKQGKPLPFDLQVLPPVRKRTPVHPYCYTDRRADGGHQATLDAVSRAEMVAGTLLYHDERRFPLYIQDTCVGSTDDAQWALAYKIAARRRYDIEMKLLDYGED
jgi:hypothetical protein